MTTKEQNLCFLHQYIFAKQFTPWIANYAEQKARECLQDIGGILGSWRTDYSECTYYYAQMINSKMVDLSTLEKVREFHERVAA